MDVHLRPGPHGAHPYSPAAVQIYIHDVDDEHWAKGGKLAADG